MTDTLKVAFLTALINGAVTWGVMSTKLEWLRSDIAKLEQRIDRIEVAKK